MDRSEIKELKIFVFGIFNLRKTKQNYRELKISFREGWKQKSQKSITLM